MNAVGALLDPPPATLRHAMVARVATEALLAEVAAWPKPGLVSDRDSGSHADMDARMLRASARTLTPYFEELADAGSRDCDMPVLRRIGMRAEVAMLATTGGINTHRGAIFGLGLICAAAGLRDAGRKRQQVPLGALVRDRWGKQILASAAPATAPSHGARARQRFGAGGASTEAARGYPHVHDVALPAVQAARAAQAGEQAAHVQGCFALIAVLEDTNLLHRGGRKGLAFARAEARGFLAAGGVLAPGWEQRALLAHEAFVARRLSPGGSADLLAIAIMLDRLEATRPVTGGS